MINILDSFGERKGSVINYLSCLDECNERADIFQIFPINHREILKIERAWSPFELDCLYRSKDKKLLDFYDHVYERCCSNVDIFIVNHENVYHPDFIKKLSTVVYTVLYTSDDPENSYLSSQPYVWAFDHVLCYSVYYDKNIKMTDKLLEWGAKRANVKPFGYQPHRKSEFTSINDFFDNRKLDIVYVGGPYNKVSDLLQVKKYFKNRFKLYGNWGGVPSLLKRFIKYGLLEYVRPISDHELLNIYQNTKIGLNMHMSYGPSNLRMWELPINGVMQVCDNPTGTAEFFNVGKEIVCYPNSDINSAISSIDYYLSNDSLRKEIAIAGYLKVLNNFSFYQTYLDILPTLVKGINDKKSTRSLSN